MGYDCSIINYQPQKQVDGYRLPILVSRHPVKRWIESLCWLPYNKQMKRKVDKFKSFAHDYMRLTPYCCDPSKINEECGTFDYYIAGGDQIWNTGCFEFEWYYYLDFVRNGKKIAYAPSMGPNGRKTIPAHLAERVRREVKTYQAVAVERRLSLIQICPWFSTRLCCLM